VLGGNLVLNCPSLDTTFVRNGGGPEDSKLTIFETPSPDIAMCDFSLGKAGSHCGTIYGKAPARINRLGLILYYEW